MKVFILDAHSIYRHGLASCLQGMSDVDAVAEAGTVREAWSSGSLANSEVVLVDPDTPGGGDFIRQVREKTGAAVVVCSSRADEQDVLAAIQAGAVGYLCKETLTPETLETGVRGASNGAGVMTPEILGNLLRGISRVSREVLEPRGLSLSWLTAREQEVLRELAQGKSNRDIAESLWVSDDTVKSHLRRIYRKLGVGTRAEAVALYIGQLGKP